MSSGKIPFQGVRKIKKCKKCHVNNPDYRKQCYNCGNLLDDVQSEANDGIRLKGNLNGRKFGASISPSGKEESEDRHVNGRFRGSMGGKKYIYDSRAIKESPESCGKERMDKPSDVPADRERHTQPKKSKILAAAMAAALLAAVVIFGVSRTGEMPVNQKLTDQTIEKPTPSANFQSGTKSQQGEQGGQSGQSENAVGAQDSPGKITEKPAAVQSQKEQASEYEIQQAMLAYSELLNSGLQLKIPYGSYTDEGWLFAPEYYYLFDMDGDGIEELLVYGQRDTVWSFRLYTYNGSRAEEIANSYETCDFSLWDNCAYTLNVYDGKYLSACTSKATIAYTSGSSNLLSYDGVSVSCANRSEPDSYMKKIDLLNGNTGVRIGTSSDDLTALYLEYNHNSVQYPAITEIDPNGAYYGSLVSVYDVDGGWNVRLNLYGWDLYTDRYVQSLCVGEQVDVAGNIYSVISIDNDCVSLGSYYLSRCSADWMHPEKSEGNQWIACDPSGQVAFYVAGIGEVFVPYDADIIDNSTGMRISLDSPYPICDELGGDIYFCLKNREVASIERIYHP